MFNRREQAALLLLAGALLVGMGVAALDYYEAVHLEEFQVVPGAVEVPRPEAAAAAAETGPVSINAASALQLQRLPGIGPAMAARIVRYRNSHGAFARLEDLQRVPGIGRRTLEKLRPFAAVE